MRVDVPFPELYRRRKWTQFLANMGVGDSVLIADEHYATVRVSASRFGKRLGWVFTTRANSHGIRVWRKK